MRLSTCFADVKGNRKADSAQAIRPFESHITDVPATTGLVVQIQARSPGSSSGTRLSTLGMARSRVHPSAQVEPAAFQPGRARSRIHPSAQAEPGAASTPVPRQSLQPSNRAGPGAAATPVPRQGPQPSDGSESDREIIK